MLKAKDMGAAAAADREASQRPIGLVPTSGTLEHEHGTTKRLIDAAQQTEAPPMYAPAEE